MSIRDSVIEELGILGDIIAKYIRDELPRIDAVVTGRAERSIRTETNKEQGKVYIYGEDYIKNLFTGIPPKTSPYGKEAIASLTTWVLLRNIAQGKEASGTAFLILRKINDDGDQRYNGQKERIDESKIDDLISDYRKIMKERFSLNIKSYLK